MPAPVQRGAAAGIQYATGALLDAGQPLRPCAPKDAGISQRRHDRQQGVEPRVGFAGTEGTTALQLWQAVRDDGGEAQLRLLAGTAAAITALDLGTMAVAKGSTRVVDQRDAPGASSQGAGVYLAIQGAGCHQQAQGPDCASVGVYPSRGRQHRGLAFAANAP
ncbi:hypothetical protein D3C81_1359590 [compost metagenome]